MQKQTREAAQEEAPKAATMELEETTPGRILRWFKWGFGRAAYGAFLVALAGFWYQSIGANYDIFFNKYKDAPETWAYFDSFWYEMGKYVNSLERTVKGQYKVILLKEYTGNIPALQFPAENQNPWERLDYLKHIPIKDPAGNRFFVYLFSRQYETELAKLKQYYPNALFQEYLNPFGQFMFHAIIVSERDVIDSQGLTVKHTFGDEIIYEGKDNVINFEGNVQKYAFPVADTMEWEGLLYVPNTDAYTFYDRERTRRFYVEIAGLRVLEASEADMDGTTKSFDATRILGQGQFPVKIVRNHKAGTTDFSWKWDVIALPERPCSTEVLVSWERGRSRVLRRYLPRTAAAIDPRK